MLTQFLRILSVVAALCGATTAAAEGRFINLHTHKEPETLDPTMAQGIIEVAYVNALFEGLTTYDPKDLSPRPGVAESWTVSPDGKVYTFILRKEAQWSDGSPITAGDFAYSYERTLNPKTAAPYASQLYPIKNAKAYNDGKVTDPKLLGITVKDPQTLVLTLENPTPYLLYLTSHMALFPVPRATIEKNGVNWTKPENFVGNGPFVLKEWIPHKYAIATKSTTYWGNATVRLPGVKFWPIEDEETALKMYDDGQLDIAWYLPTLKSPALRTRPDYRKAPWLASDYYWVNVNSPRLNNVKVRRALALAIDRKTLAEQFLYGVHTPAGTLTAEGLPGYTPPGNAATFDVKEAKKLLAEAGVKDPSSLQIEIIYNTQALHKTIAQVVQQMWKQNLGITASLRNEEWKSYLKDLKQKAYADAIRGGWIGDYVDPMTFLDMLVGSSPLNYSNWRNAQYDDLIAKATVEANPQRRMQILQSAEKILLDEMPLIPLVHQNKDYLIKSVVKGYYPNLQDVHSWQGVYLEGAGGERRPAWTKIQGQFKN